ncbi:MAG: AAA family ATPase [Planctomycetes bacterium]|nr:AAA family ATPase [Planctomycetota bacterium]
MPPHLAGRQSERAEFLKLLEQSSILENAILTGLRGVGKTVLLDTLKPEAIQSGWRWVGTDLSESTSISEDRIALRLITDLAVVTSSIVVHEEIRESIGFLSETTTIRQTLDFQTLTGLYQQTPGLASDKIKHVLEVAWSCLRQVGGRGVIFAYDEAQNLSDHAGKDEYPLSLLLDVFQSIQKKGIPFMLVMAGLPTLFPKLVEARTFAERMFHVIFLDRLTEEESRDAIVTPLKKFEDGSSGPVFEESMIRACIDCAGGYPYFIQFICREIVDAFMQWHNNDAIDDVKDEEERRSSHCSLDAIIRKLDADFFAGRWSRVTDRQRDLLVVIARLESSSAEFTVQEVVEGSKNSPGKPFSPSHVNQMLTALAKSGLIYKTRHGKYCFAIPLMDRFIVRQVSDSNSIYGSPDIFFANSE